MLTKFTDSNEPNENEPKAHVHSLNNNTMQKEKKKKNKSQTHGFFVTLLLWKAMEAGIYVQSNCAWS